MLRLLPLGVVLAAIAAANAGCGTAQGRGTLRPLAIGALFSSTGKGASIGPQQIRGAQLAVTELNRAGGVDGAPLKLIVRDDRTDTSHAIAQLRSLVGSSHVLGVLGPSLSIVAFAADPVADRLKTPVLAVSNTAAGIVSPCSYPCSWIWRASVGEAVTVPANVDAYTQRTHARSAVIAYTDPDALGEQEADAAAATFRRDGVLDVSRVRIPATAADTAPYVARALRSKPSVLFLGSSFATTIVGMIKDARAQGFRGAILGGNVLNSDTTAKLAGRAGAGALSGVAWSDDNAFPANASFMSAYVQRYGTPPDEFAAQAYTGVLILAQALKRAHLAGSTLTVADQRARLQEGLRKVALTTPLGPFRFTANHDVRQIVWIRALDGRGGNRLVGFCNPGC